MTRFLSKLGGKRFMSFMKHTCGTKLVPQVQVCIRNMNELNRLYCTSKYKQIYLIDEDENTNLDCRYNINKYSCRSHTCGQLKSSNVGERVVLCGWLEYHRMNKFIVLRDSYGETQLLINEKDSQLTKILENLPLESIIQAKGTVLSRPKEMINKKQSTGEIEVLVNELKTLNKAKHNLPFNIREFQKAKESLRMQYRYLDLRFPQMQRNLRARSILIHKMREFLINNHFVDVETPTLFKATPGGAKEFIVPTRFPGEFYSLVQSPQQFKQMLMAGAIDRYFQVARCYRDESSRSDRQPEFTQLDIEMSFTNMNGILMLVEELLFYAWPEFLDTAPVKFPRITYQEAMESYGTDKPDTRFDFKLQDCTDLLKGNQNLVDTEDFGAYFVQFPKEYANLNKRVKEIISNVSARYDKAKLVKSKINTTKEWVDKIGKLLSPAVALKLVENYNIVDETVLFLAYGNKNEVLSLLGNIRVEYVNFLENLGMTIRKDGMHLSWVLDFPLFELSKETGRLQSAHHPFTAPHPEDIHLLATDPLKVRALAYDLVLNGNEIAGGSVRIHDPSLQEAVLDLLNIKRETMQHIIDMLGSGCPPHGGIAFGLDRLLSILLGTTSIRDVIAFPKNFEGRDPLSGAPSPISKEDEKLYHIKSIKT
ncbi:hypothetical protein NQ317_005232 [Molorchus minor]|uniref:Aminoacyl-transfer RNA synthetases class-II family profile domain-containing protein n=1 Tax=Molorchus minor TaxID=1323400 RepID=A0ABQ9JQ20_9CUCU|nr:hypothetical protein NQ317_005232 [Molorchus minor]